MTDSDKIRLEFGLDDIEGKGDSEKLTVLLKIAFLNHKTLSEHGKILFGDGEDRKVGICETVRTTRNLLVWLWGVFCAVSGAYFVTLIYHISAVSK